MKAIAIKVWNSGEIQGWCSIALGITAWVFLWKYLLILLVGAIFLMGVLAMTGALE